jgi:cellulose synthase operon protein C
VERDPLAGLWASRARLRLSAVPEVLEVTASLPPDFEYDVRWGPEQRLVHAIAESRDRGPTPFSWGFLSGWVSEWPELGHELGSILLPGPVLGALEPHPRPLDLRLEMVDRTLAAVPWELSRAPDTKELLALDSRISSLARGIGRSQAALDEARFVQVALNRIMSEKLPVDGELGPNSGTLLAEYQRQRRQKPDGVMREETLAALQFDLGREDVARDGPPLVILAQASTARQYKGSRGKASFDVDARWLYEASGFQVWVVEDPTVEEIRKAIDEAGRAHHIPDVLHLSGSLRESSGGSAFTFLAGEWYSEHLGGSRYSDELPVTAIDYLLEAFPRESFRPLLILDIDRPPTISEAVGHLLLRNAFAADLCRLGHCRALLATGLVGGHAEQLYETLVASVSKGCSLAEVLRNIHAIGTDHEFYGAPELPPASTALFSHLPWLRPVAR